MISTRVYLIQSDDLSRLEIRSNISTPFIEVFFAKRLDSGEFKNKQSIEIDKNDLPELRYYLDLIIEQNKNG
jgi:hypothetical protein